MSNSGRRKSGGQNVQDDWYNEFSWIRRDAIEICTSISDFQKVYPQILACTPKCQSLGVHVPPNENVCGHAEVYFYAWNEKQDKLRLVVLSLFMRGFLT